MDFCNPNQRLLTACSLYTELYQSMRHLPTSINIFDTMVRFLRTKYQQYKHDTLQLSAWLAQTAVQHGYPLDSFAISTQPLTNGDERRSKNAEKKAKARARAKTKGTENGSNGEIDAKDESSTAPIIPLQGDYLLKPRQFVEIARFLVQRQVRIPTELMQLIRRCISLRFSCLKRFLPQPDLSTVSHQFFINVLRDVGTIFKDYRDNSQGGKNSSRGSEEMEVQNRYAFLSEELAADFNKPGNEEASEESVPDISLPAPETAPGLRISAMQVNFALEETLEESIMTLFTFFEDLHSVRAYIKDLWRDYKQGEIDLITASVTTNTALELLRKPHDDIRARILEPLYENNLSIMILMLRNFVFWRKTGHGLDSRQLLLFTDLGDDSSDMQDVYDLFLIPNLQVLNGLSEIITDGLAPMYKQGHFGHYDARLDFERLPYSKRAKQTTILICETFAEYLTLVMVNKSAGQPSMNKSAANLRQTHEFLFDEIAVEMQTFAQAKEPSLLLMFYSQVFIDINFMLGETAKKGLRDLREGAARMVRTLDERATVEGSVQPDTWPRQNEMIMEMFEREAEYWREMNPVSDMRKFIKVDRSVASTSLAPSSLMELNPMLCGLWLFKMQLNYQQLGFTLVNAWGTILYTAHLYAACKQSDFSGDTLPFPEWPDMDKIMEMHGEADLFGGKIPLNIEDSYDSFLRMMGYSADVLIASKHVGTEAGLPAFLINPRREFKMGSKHRPQGLRDRTQILPIFLQKYLGGAPGYAEGVPEKRADICIDINVIEALLRDIHQRKEPKTKQPSNKKRKLLRKERKHGGPKFSVVQLLSVLESGLILETSSIRFDYVSMHVRCIRILRRVQASAHDYLSQAFGPEYIENDSQLPFLVGCILHFAVMSGRAAEQLGIQRVINVERRIGSKLLLGATNAMREALKNPRERDAEVRKLANIVL